MILAIGLFSSCSETPVPSGAQQLTAAAVPVQSLSGLVALEGNDLFFTPCDDTLRYPLADTSGKVLRLYRENTQPAPVPGETVWAQLKILKKNSVFQVVAVDSITSRNKMNPCPVFDFWCAGTEPFWSLYISKAEKIARFKTPLNEEGRTFRYSEPVQKGEMLTYTLEDIQAPGTFAVVTIRKEACSDGMSDIRYNYSAGVQWGKTLWKGCAEKWGDVKKEGN